MDSETIIIRDISIISLDGDTSESPLNTPEETSSTFPSPLFSYAMGNQRRRVNPESLALRLGPDLVRDLEALIQPGVIEMPSFAVRKELQERYNIDRRHIYDYFHSRGLRVIKEDKNGNFIIPKELPNSSPNLRPLRQAPSRDHLRSRPAKPISSDTKWNSQKPRGITKAKPGRPRKNANIINKKISEPVLVTDISINQTDMYYSVNPLSQYDRCSLIVGDQDQEHDFVSKANPLDDTFSLDRAIGDVSYSYRHKSVFERMHEIYDLESRAASLAVELEPFGEISCGLLSPIREPLPKEGHGFYNFLSDALGPACGIQESVGTYRAHMQERSRLFYEELLLAPYNSSDHINHSRAAQSQNHKSTLRENEYRLWLSSTEHIDKSGKNLVSRNRYSLSSSASRKITQKSAAGTPYIKHCADNKVSEIGNTLDELFPALPEDQSITDITRSPVVRTEYSPYIYPDYLSFLHDSSAVDEGSEEPVSRSLASYSSELRGYGYSTHGRTPLPGTITTEPPFFEHSKNLEHSDLLLRPSSLLCDAFKTSNQVANDPVSSTPRVGRVNRKVSTQARFAPCSPVKRVICGREKIKTRSVASRGTRLRTTSAGGGI
ncbi:hypothetical protein BJ138DRAFT_917209 [Hygrophoropsis aurantiaca]|uniref:Uncharacterized protein n=1 Tax=Hygrophoropsis aurantiaca TaxID=72124 RepID=A0ACB8ATN7_9AGAM|nr:hypothetical protein BJ138DRAFT_917209 [Hygrophoropsis aurantiaca]